MSDIDLKRRRLLGVTAASIALAEIVPMRVSQAATSASPTSSAASSAAALARFAALKQIDAGVLNIGYVDIGPVDGPVVLLLHGYPYDIHSYIDVAPLLAAAGCRVIVPHLRGHGTTTFLDPRTSRSGQQAAIGVDVIALLDALHIRRAVFAGYDWGGRAACVAAALWPERCNGLVSVNSYLIQDIARAGTPLSPKIEAGFWYQFYFTTERGRAGLAANRNGIAHILWERNSPTWRFDEATFQRSAAAFVNPDYVDIVIHSYRHRLSTAPGHPQYALLEERLAAQPVITVPTITIDGDSDGVIAATDGKSTAAKFGPDRTHVVLPGIGHNVPQEAPKEFAAAVLKLVGNAR